MKKPMILKALKIKLKPNNKQKELFNEWFNTTNYLYNKTIECVNKKIKTPLDFQGLRDLLVTNETKKNNDYYDEVVKKIKELEKYKKLLELNNKNKEKTKINLITSMINDLKNKKKKLPIEKNNNVNYWELKTPKEIRAGAVNDVCKAYKTGFSNLKNGTIRFFNMKYRKNNNPKKSFLIAKNIIENKNGNLKIAPSFFKENNTSCFFKMGKKTLKKHKNIEIKNDCRIIKNNHNYFLVVPVETQIQEINQYINYCGIDPGVRTFMTSFGNNSFTEYDYKKKNIDDLDKKIDTLKCLKKRIKKRKLVRIQTDKENLINELHWKTINHLTKSNDILFYGDIKSHNIVKNKNNKRLNRDINNLKFFTFKQRLLFKAIERGKKVFEIKEQYTTKTCSFCGMLNEPRMSKVYECKSCNKKVGRDINASKNILMKGIITHL